MIVIISDEPLFTLCEILRDNGYNVTMDSSTNNIKTKIKRAVKIRSLYSFVKDRFDPNISVDSFMQKIKEEMSKKDCQSNS